MKKLIGLILLSQLLSLAIYAQQIVWRRALKVLNHDQIIQVAKVDSGYLAIGTMFSQVYNFPNRGQVPNYTFAKIKENGDSVFIKQTQTFGEAWGNNTALRRCPDGNLYNPRSIINTLTEVTSLRLYKVNQDGQTIWFKEYPNTDNSWFPSNICILADGGALIVGLKDGSQPNSQEGFALRVDSLGTELWRRSYPTSIISCINYAEILKGSTNKFLISGNAGQYIWAAWLDENGTTTDSRYIYQDSANRVLADARVLQAPNGNLVVYCVNQFDSIVSFWGIYDRLGVRRIYGKKMSSIISCLTVNSASEILMQGVNSNDNVLRKYNPNGRIIDSLVTLRGTTTYNGLVDVVWSGGDTAVFAGYYPTDLRRYMGDFYFVKIAGVGHEYIAAVPSIVSEKPFTLFPNPAKDWFSVSGEGVITLYTASGQMVLSQEVNAEDKVSLANLPQGLYMYRFVSGEKVLSGKVVRE
jgi:Secretion system C-terminal sorting domain